ncbi:MAG: DUF1080 domain-containing protein [Lacipirellulaceae bacterium]
MKNLSKTVHVVLICYLLLACSLANAKEGSGKKGSAAKATTTKAAPGKAVMLFNGKNLDGWKHHLGKSKVKREDVWSVEDGVLKCKGRPAGYLYTEKDYENYVLTLQWRWPGKGGNNGVLVHFNGKNKGVIGIWPKSLEVQLHADNAGDFWVIGTEIDVPNEESRVKGRRHLNLNDGAEKKLGEWNDLEITCKGDEVTVKVNGKLVNRGTNSTVTKGRICLQSEGTPIEYRRVMLRKL